MELNRKRIATFLLLLVVGLPAFAQSGGAKPDKSKKNSNAGPSGGSDSPSSGSALWVTPRSGECQAVNGKALILALRKSPDSKTQPYFVSVAQDELQTFYSGDALIIEVISGDKQDKENRLIN